MSTPATDSTIDPKTPARSDNGTEIDATSPQEEPRLYRASPRYWVLAAAALGSAILLLVDMVNGIRWDAVAFAILGLICGLWALWMATTRVLVTPQGVWVRRFSATYFVDYQQMLDATSQGRLVSTVSLTYHPRLDNGLVDVERVGALIIPGLSDQDELLAQIEPHIRA